MDSNDFHKYEHVPDSDGVLSHDFAAGVTEAEARFLLGRRSIFPLKDVSNETTE